MMRASEPQCLYSLLKIVFPFYNGLCYVNSSTQPTAAAVGSRAEGFISTIPSYLHPPPPPSFDCFNYVIIVT